MLEINPAPQIFPDVFASIPTLDAVVPQIEARAYWDNQTIEVRLHVAQDTELDWEQFKLQWELNKVSGVEGIRTGIGSANVLPVRSVRVPMPRVDAAQLIPVTLRLVDSSGSELTKRSNQLFVLPSCAAQARYTGNIVVMTATGREADVFRQLNYAVDNELSKTTELIVTDAPSPAILDFVKTGGKLLFINEGVGSIFWQRGRTKASEDKWITSTSWLRPNVYQNLQLEDPLSLPFERVMPRRSIGGLPQEDPTVQCDFLAGRMSGWVQRPSIHTLQFTYGQGKVIMTTYTLLEALRTGDPDPVAVVMLNDLIDYLVSDQCRPTLQAPI